MKIIFLGTNGWYDTTTGYTPCILIDTKNYYVVLDAGNSFFKLDQYIKEEKPIYLFISHLHIDHISGFHILSKFKFKNPLTVFIPQGTLESFNTFANHPFMMPIHAKELSYEVDVKELSEGKHEEPFNIECIKMFHADLSFGYRFNLEEKIIAYSGDTGICGNCSILAKDVDLLIHECTLPAGYPEGTWGHSNPVSVAQLAEKSNTKKLILTHFDASKYTTLEKREEAEKEAQKIFPNTIAAKDDLIIEV